MELDKKDQKILYELERNARQSDAQIGRKVQLSKEVVSYRIKRLQKEGIINSFVSIINTHAFGYLGFRVFFELKDISEDVEKKFINFLKDNCVWIVRCRGAWSYNSLIYTNNLEKLYQFLEEIKSKFDDNFLNLQVSPVIKIYHYKRNFIVGGSKDKKDYFALLGEDSKTELDENDFKVIKAIVNNARATTVDLAENAGLTERIVRHRIKKLIDNNIILGFRSNLDIVKLGYNFYKIHLTLDKHTKEMKDKLLNYSHSHPNIVYVTNTVGGWDFEFEACFKNNKEFYEFMDKLVKKFPGAIRNHDVLEYDKHYQEKYFQTLE